MTNTLTLRHISFVLTLALTAAVPAAASAADQYPSKPITLLVPFAAGSVSDQLARALAQGMSAQAKVPVVVDNKPGASAMIGAQAVARAAADGYTILISSNTTHATNQHLYKTLPYDPVKDFAPLTLLGKGELVMVVRADAQAQTVQDVLQQARSRPVSYGSGSSSTRIAGELLQQLTGAQLLHVPYRGNPLAISDLLGGAIDLMFTDPATGLPHIQSGKLRPLGVTGLQRNPLLPEVPTIAEAAQLPNYEMGYWFAAWAPAGLPEDKVKSLNAWLARATETAAAQQFYASSGTSRVTSTPEALAHFQSEEARKWGEIVKKAGIEPE